MKATNAVVNIIAIIVGLVLLSLIAGILILELAPDSSAALYVEQVVNKAIVMFDL